MAAWLPMMGEDFRALFAANALQCPYSNGTAKSGEAFFRWADSDIHPTQRRVENAPTHSSRKRGCQQASYQSNATASQADFSYSPWREAHHKLAHALLSNYRPQGRGIASI